MRVARPSFGILGSIFAILLLTVAIEFGASTLLYERASRVLVREDEARRLAEHLVIAAKLVANRPPAERAAMAAMVSTNRYQVRWSPAPAAMPPMAPELAAMRDRIVSWEPELRATGLGLRLARDGNRRVVTGEFRLGDGSWLRFATAGVIEGWTLALGRIVVALIPALVLIAGGGLLVRQLLDPLRVLARAAGRIGRGDTALPSHGILPETGPREMRRVVRAFNAMQARIHSLITDHTQALAAVGHDFRTPLARMQLRADLIADPELRRAFGGDIAELEAMVASLLAYLGGEGDPEVPARTDVAVLLATLADDAADRGRHARYDGPVHCEIVVRPLGLKRALANLVDNALHYGDAVTLSVVDGAAEVVLRVDDDGPGIAPADLDRVRQPFTRLDDARGRNTNGLGLGLSIVVREVEAGGGTLRLANRAGGGLRAEIVLPRGSGETVTVPPATG